MYFVALFVFVCGFSINCKRFMRKSSHCFFFILNLAVFLTFKILMCKQKRWLALYQAIFIFHEYQASPVHVKLYLEGCSSPEHQQRYSNPRIACSLIDQQLAILRDCESRSHWGVYAIKSLLFSKQHNHVVLPSSARFFLQLFPSKTVLWETYKHKV